MRLDISDNPMTSEIAADLAATLAEQPRLRCLNLNDTSLGDEGVSEVAVAVAGAAPELEVRTWGRGGGNFSFLLLFSWQLSTWPMALHGSHLGCEVAVPRGPL